MARNNIDVRDRPFYRELGKRICELRKERQFTQSELAQRIGVTQQALFGYEIGERRVPTCILPALARALDVSLEPLLGLEPAPRARMARVSPAQLRHLEQLRKLGRVDRFAVMRITAALSQFER